MTFTLPESAAKTFNRDSAKKFRKSIEQLANEEISISYGNSILNLSSIDSLRLIYEHIPKTDSERIFKKFLIKNFSDAENVCRGSGSVATISFLKSLESTDDLDKSLEALKLMSKSTRRGSLDDLKIFLDQISTDKSVRDISAEIISRGGFSASCEVETTYDLCDKILLNESCVFQVRLDPQFSAAVKRNKFSASNACIVVADGVIEEISEIHHLLEYFSKNKKSCFLICRGYGKDIISTLSTNFLRKSLNVIPGTLIYDLGSINSLKDICVISNADMISNLKGDKFSTIDLDSISTIESVSLSLEHIEIKNKKEYPRVVSLMKNLRKQIDDELVQEKVDLLEKRISSLSPRKIRILLSNHDKDSVGIKKDRIKTTIAMINDFCQNGKINLAPSDDRMIDEIVSYFKKSGIEVFPSMCFFEGIKVGLRNAKMIKSSSQIILVNS